MGHKDAFLLALSQKPTQFSLQKIKKNTGQHGENEVGECKRKNHLLRSEIKVFLVILGGVPSRRQRDGGTNE